MAGSEPDRALTRALSMPGARGPLPGVAQAVPALAVRRGGGAAQPVLCYFGIIDFLQVKHPPSPPPSLSLCCNSMAGCGLAVPVVLCFLSVLKRCY